MYIITFEKYVSINNDCGYYAKQYSEFSSMEDAKEFITEIYDINESDIRQICLWKSELIDFNIDELLD